MRHYDFGTPMIVVLVVLLAAWLLFSCSGPGSVEPGFDAYCKTHAGVGDCP